MVKANIKGDSTINATKEKIKSITLFKNLSYIIKNNSKVFNKKLQKKFHSSNIKNDFF